MFTAGIVRPSAYARSPPARAPSAASRRRAAGGVDDDRLLLHRPRPPRAARGPHGRRERQALGPRRRLAGAVLGRGRAEDARDDQEQLQQAGEGVEHRCCCCCCDGCRRRWSGGVGGSSSLGRRRRRPRRRRQLLRLCRRRRLRARSSSAPPRGATRPSSVRPRLLLFARPLRCAPTEGGLGKLRHQGRR